MHTITHRSLDRERLGKAKRSYTTRRVDAAQMTTLRVRDWHPAPGDLALARIEEIGQHARIEMPNGRRAVLRPGDEIIVCCGSRYAPDQFEAVLQSDQWPTDLVAAGGIASNHLSRHQRMKSPTVITTLGAVCGDDRMPLNVADFALPKLQTRPAIPVLLVAGTSMNSGKTTTAAAIVSGFADAGLRVGYAKVTGTGAGPDPWLMADSGAHEVLDFTDGGYASSFQVPIDELEVMSNSLIDHLADRLCDLAVLEVADGLLQEETAALLSSSSFRLRIFGTVFTAYDAMGALTGVHWLSSFGYRILGLGGQMSSAPLSAREAELATGVPVYTLSEFADGCINTKLLCGCEARSQAS